MSEIGTDDLDQYLADPERFASRWLHMYKDRGEAALRDLVGIQWLAWKSAQPDPPFRLNVLVVDNDSWTSVSSHATEQWLKLLSGPVTMRFHHYRPESRNPESWTAADVVSPDELGASSTIRWDELDLILQDVHLGVGAPLGFELTERYFELAPQALVFLLTAMQVEALASSGVGHRVDRVMSKRYVQGILWEYHQRFGELFGKLLWPVWGRAFNSTSDLTSSSALRRLFGSLRKWQLEPEILFHGYSLPEMVEHAHRHTSGLWSMTQDVLVPLLKQSRDLLTDDERVLLCLGLWLHDVGHVGDENFASADTIRRFHGAISDRKLLKDPEALGLGWLNELCTASCRGDDARPRLRRLNAREGCEGGEICPLRRAGILARYHQQSAPMTANGLLSILRQGKPISPYCRVQLTWNDHALQECDDADHDIQQWLSAETALGWDASTVRLLEDFAGCESGGPDLLKVAQLVRWLDGLHLHECRVGSRTRLATLRSYLKQRESHVDARIDALVVTLDRHGVHDEVGLRMRGQLDELDDYRRLLRVQEVHHWLHQSVKQVKVEDGHVVFKLRREVLDSMKPAIFPGDGAATWSSLALDIIEAELKHIDSPKVASLVNPHARFYRYEVDERDTRDFVRVTNAREQPSSPTARPERGARALAAGSLFLDCDPGVDDALALILAARFFEHIDISATAGNVGVEQTVRNARLVGSLLQEHFSGLSVRLFRGSSASLLGDKPAATSVHGRDGLGEVPLVDQLRPKAGSIEVSGRGAEQLIRLLGSGDVDQAPTLVFTGPLTNLAMALLQEPLLVQRMGAVFIMGGAFESAGNITAGAEFNSYFDPQSLEIVLRAFADHARRGHGRSNTAGRTRPELFFIPLDVTERVHLRKEWIEQPSVDDKLACWAHAMLHKYFLFHSRAARTFDMSWFEKAREPSTSVRDIDTWDGSRYEAHNREVFDAERGAQSARSLNDRLLFSYLHDPLAVWIAHRFRTRPDDVRSCFVSARVVVHSGRDRLRGSLQVLEGKRPELHTSYRESEAGLALESSTYNPGTTVNYLSVKEFTLAHYREFLGDLFAACGWQMSDKIPAILRRVERTK